MAREPFNRIWTETPTVDDFDEPTESMWDEGWRGGADQDPPEAFAQNWWQNRADFALQQIERNGAMDYHADTPYGIGGLALGSDGIRYASITSGNQGNDPVTDGGINWKPVSYVRASGDAPVFGVRAWANFDGSEFDGSGNVSVRGSGNISSILRTSPGVYQVTFSTPMSGPGYCVSLGVSQLSETTTPRADAVTSFSYTTQGFTIETWHSDDDKLDCEIVNFTVIL